MATSIIEQTFADDTLFEVIDGQRVELPPMGASESWLASYLAGLLNRFAMEQIGLAGLETLFDLNIGHHRRPDVAFVRYDRWPRGRLVPEGESWAMIPNLAIEVVSPTNTQNRVLDKVADYFEAGVSLVWVVYPVHEQVYVYTSFKQVRILDRGDVLDGGEVIPGFLLPLADLFPANE